MNRLVTGKILGLILLLALLSPTIALAEKPYVLVQFWEDRQSRSQERVHTSTLSLEIELELGKSVKKDEYPVESVAVGVAQGREVIGKTGGSEAYVVSGASAAVKTPGATVKLWRDPKTKIVIAVSLPLLDLQVNWQGPWGAEPADKLVLGPVSFSAGNKEEMENQPARPKDSALPKWLLDAGVHPDFAVNSRPDEITYLGGGAWLREEPEGVWEKTYSWELVLPE